MLRVVLKIYLSTLKALLGVFLLPFKWMSYFDTLRVQVDYILGTSVKEIMSKELDKCFTPLYVKSNNDPRLIAIDLGSRGGPIKEISINSDKFRRIILCEGESEEALKLKSLGYEVIDKFVGGEVGKGIFYDIRHNPGASSMKKPCSKFTELYGDKVYYLEHLKYQEIAVEVTDLPTEMKQLSINQVDLLKLDIQGFEYEVLSSFLTTSIRPLVIHCEVEQVPLYLEQSYGCEIDTLLLKAHYICIRRSDEHFRGSMPIWCDKLYIPNVLQKEGLRIVESRLDDFLLLSRIYRFEKLAERLLELSKAL
jgi:FkbM family methyltransferase